MKTNTRLEAWRQPRLHAKGLFQLSRSTWQSNSGAKKQGVHPKRSKINQTNDATLICAEAVEALEQKGAKFVDDSSVLRVPARLLEDDGMVDAFKPLISAGAQMDLQHQLGGTAMLILTRPRNPQNTAHQEYLNKSVHGMIAQIAFHRVLMEDVIDERKIGGEPEKDLHKQLQELQESLTKAEKLSPNADQSGIICKMNNIGTYFESSVW